MSRLRVAAAAACLMTTSLPAGAADLSTPAPTAKTDAAIPSAVGWFVHIGPAGVIFAPSASISAAGAGVAGASIKATNNLAIAADIGYFFTPEWSASLTLANPPTTSVRATGTLAAVGKLGSTTYLPPMLTGQYHFRQLGAFQPYVGAGVSYMIILDNNDSALTNFRVRSNLGPVVQAGADYMINDHWGLFADVKHVWMSTTAAGTLGVTPVTAKVRLDPTIVSGGISYRF